MGEGKRMNKKTWRVWFDSDTALIVGGDDEFMAKTQAKFLAWTVTGYWLTVERVEELK